MSKESKFCNSIACPATTKDCSELQKLINATAYVGEFLARKNVNSIDLYDNKKLVGRLTLKLL